MLRIYEDCEELLLIVGSELLTQNGRLLGDNQLAGRQYGCLVEPLQNQEKYLNILRRLQVLPGWSEHEAILFAAAWRRPPINAGP